MSVVSRRRIAPCVPGRCAPQLPRAARIVAVDRIVDRVARGRSHGQVNALLIYSARRRERHLRQPSCDLPVDTSGSRARRDLPQYRPGSLTQLQTLIGDFIGIRPLAQQASRAGLPDIVERILRIRRGGRQVCIYPALPCQRLIRTQRGAGSRQHHAKPGRIRAEIQHRVPRGEAQDRRRHRPRLCSPDQETAAGGNAGIGRERVFRHATVFTRQVQGKPREGNGAVAAVVQLGKGILAQSRPRHITGRIEGSYHQVATVLCGSRRRCRNTVGSGGCASGSRCAKRCQAAEAGEQCKQKAKGYGGEPAPHTVAAIHCEPPRSFVTARSAEDATER